MALILKDETESCDTFLGTLEEVRVSDEVARDRH